jgi:hypothetical protein
VTGAPDIPEEEFQLTTNQKNAKTKPLLTGQDFALEYACEPGRAGDRLVMSLRFDC